MNINEIQKESNELIVVFTKEFMYRFNGRFTEGFNVYKKNKKMVVWDGAQSIFTEDFSDIKIPYKKDNKTVLSIGNAMLWIDTHVNVVNEEIGVKRTFTIHYELKGNVKLYRHKRCYEEYILKFYDYSIGYNMNEILDKFETWYKDNIINFRKERGV
jgi:hypothetical protein